MSTLCQKQTHAVQHKTDKWSPRRCVGIVLILDLPHAVRQSALGKHFHQAPRRRYVDKGSPLRPNTILGALEESIARRSREGRIWPAFLDQFWIGRRVDATDANRADDPRPLRRPMPKA